MTTATKAKKTTKQHADPYQVIHTYTITVDESGITPPPFANARNPKSAKYAVSVRTDGFIEADRDGTYTTASRLGDGVYRPGEMVTFSRNADGSEPYQELRGESDPVQLARGRSFAAAVEAVFLSHGFVKQNGAWSHPELGGGRWDKVCVTSDGRFTAKQGVGSHVVNYVIIDHAKAQEILDAHTDDDGMI